MIGFKPFEKLQRGLFTGKTYLLIFTLLISSGQTEYNRCIWFSGDYRAGVTPLPISNREVKLRLADGTTTAGLWESRSSPDFILNSNWIYPVGVFYFYTVILSLSKDIKSKIKGFHHRDTEAQRKLYSSPPFLRRGGTQCRGGIMLLLCLSYSAEREEGHTRVGRRTDSACRVSGNLT